MVGRLSLTKSVCAQEEEKNPPVNGDNGGSGHYSAQEWSALLMDVVQTSIKVSTSLLATVCVAPHIAPVFHSLLPGFSLRFLPSRCVT